MMQNEQFYAVILSTLSSAIQNRIWRMSRGYTPSRIFSFLSGEDLQTQSFISQVYSGDPVDTAERIIALSEMKSIRIIDMWDPEYPPLLKELSNPPIVLYALGEFINQPCIAIVGTRKADPQSRSVARRLANELSSCGFAISSGMAVGIDREAHMGALEAKGGTIGVLANGIDVIYPQSNADLFQKIRASSRSILISEYPPGIIAGKWTFIKRNRIISGLSHGTVVVMAGGRSGALITARYAVEQNREVFACPGHAFYEEYSGCHQLIQNGAKLVSKTEDILDELSLLWPAQRNRNNAKREGHFDAPVFFEQKPCRFDENSIEGVILDILQEGGLSIDAIIRRADKPASEINQALVNLELSGDILRNGNTINKK